MAEHTPGKGDLEVEVDDKNIVAQGVACLTLRSVDGADLPEWEPGAHVDVHLKDGLLRQYSLCGDPHDTSTMQVAVLREVDSRGGSVHVHDAVNTGDRLAISLPRNRFPLVGAERYVFVAGGIGITPIVAMIREVERRGGDWTLLYGGRSRESMAFADDLEKDFDQRVSIRPQDETGLLDLDAAFADLDPDTAVYCCGPEPLLQAVTDRVPAGQLHLERFVAVPVEHEDNTTFEVEFAKTGQTFRVGADKSILEIAEEAGIEPAFSCREGTCGTCEVAVLEGRPEHRDSILDEEEREANDCMMICVSRSRDSRLVIDL